MNYFDRIRENLIYDRTRDPQPMPQDQPEPSPWESVTDDALGDVELAQVVGGLR